jgi:hypothetical protein
LSQGIGLDEQTANLVIAFCRVFPSA